MPEPGQPFVETVRIQSFGCARDVTLELSRLHALIGPNDSGKSTMLHAIRTVAEIVARSPNIGSRQALPVYPPATRSRVRLPSCDLSACTSHRSRPATPTKSR